MPADGVAVLPRHERRVPLLRPRSPAGSGSDRQVPEGSPSSEPSSTVCPPTPPPDPEATVVAALRQAK